MWVKKGYRSKSRKEDGERDRAREKTTADSEGEKGTGEGRTLEARGKKAHSQRSEVTR